MQRGDREYVSRKVHGCSARAKARPLSAAPPTRPLEAPYKQGVSRASEVAERRIVLLNGPAGVGKTTVARRLAAGARNGACIHGDELKRFVVTREPDTVGQGLSYLGAAALTDVFLDAGYDLVLFEFVFERRLHAERFLGALRSDVAVDLLTLWASLQTVTARARTRTDRRPAGDSVEQCWRAMAANLSELGAVIDARGSVEEVVAGAQSRIAAGTARLSLGAP